MQGNPVNVHNPPGKIGSRKPAGIDWRAGYKNLAKHYDRLMQRPAFADTVPAA